MNAGALGRALVSALLLLSTSEAARAEPARNDAAYWTRLAAQSWLERAEARARRGDIAEAITAYTEALRIDPDSGTACLELAALRAALGDVREAERLLGRATRIDAVRADALTRRAQLYLAQKRSELALLDLQAAAETEPTSERLRTLASFFVQRRAWAAALSVFRKLHASGVTRQTESERRETDDTIAALSALAAEADGVQHDMGELEWVRRALRHLAHNQRAAPEGAARAPHAARQSTSVSR